MGTDPAGPQGGIGIAFAAFADAAVAWQSLVADFRTSPPESRDGKVSDGGPPPDLGVFV